MQRRFLCTMLAVALCTPACSGSGAGGSAPIVPNSAQPSPTSPPASKIQHVVIMVQENRSFDNFFATYPAADGTTSGKTHTGQTVQLKEVGLVASDIDHRWQTFLTEYDGGKMDGFDLIHYGGIGGGPPAGLYPYQYVDPSDIAPYWEIAKQYVLADHMFETESSGSFIAHQDLIAGGTKINPYQGLVNYPTHSPWGCDAPHPTKTSLLTVRRRLLVDAGPYPCVDYPTLRDSLDAGNVSWKYYAPPIDQIGGLWTAFDAIRAVRYGSEWQHNISSPETTIFTDISKGKLPAVSWVIPDYTNSDHPGHGITGGPSWIAAVVNAIGENPTLWKSTAIIVVWDDWGGFYDHVPPTQIDYQGLGFRVPMLVVSPYAKRGYVSHTQYEFGSILKFVEQNWGLPAIGTTDVRATSIGDVFNLNQPPHRFHAIHASLPRAYFVHHRPSYLPVDTE